MPLVSVAWGSHDIQIKELSTDNNGREGACFNMSTCFPLYVSCGDALKQAESSNNLWCQVFWGYRGESINYLSCSLAAGECHNALQQIRRLFEK